MLTTPDVPGIIFFAATIACFVAYDRLIRRQYEIAREQWERDGRPVGMFWAPPETPVRSWARGKAMFRLLVSTPGWIADDDASTRLQRTLRVLWLMGLAAWVWLAALLIIGTR